MLQLSLGQCFLNICTGPSTNITELNNLITSKSYLVKLKLCKDLIQGATTLKQDKIQSSETKTSVIKYYFTSLQETKHELNSHGKKKKKYWS